LDFEVSYLCPNGQGQNRKLSASFPAIWLEISRSERPGETVMTSHVYEGR